MSWEPILDISRAHISWKTLFETYLGKLPEICLRNMFGKLVGNLSRKPLGKDLLEISVGTLSLENRPGKSLLANFLGNLSW